jgi:hypothetical protein
MTCDEIHPALREALGIHEGLRRLGYPAGDIFVGLNDRLVLVILKANGKDFTCEAGIMDGVTNEEFASAWAAAVTTWNDGSLPTGDMERIFKNSIAGSQSVTFLLALVQKGIYPRLKLGAQYN